MTGANHGAGTAIRIAARPDTIDSSTIVGLPKKASGRLPSRGQVAVQVSIIGHESPTVHESDGWKGHWMKVDQEQRHTANIDAGDLTHIWFNHVAHR